MYRPSRPSWNVLKKMRKYHLVIFCKCGKKTHGPVCANCRQCPAQWGDGMGQARVMTRLEMCVLSDDSPWQTFGNIYQQQQQQQDCYRDSQPGQPVRTVHRSTNHGPRVGSVLYGLRPLWSGLTGLGNHRHSFRMVARHGASFLHFQGFWSMCRKNFANLCKSIVLYK